MGKAMFVERSGNLTSLVPPEWFTDLENSSTWLRLYTALFIPHAKFKAVVETFVSRIDKSQPLLAFQDRTFIGWGTLKGMKIPIMTATMFAEESGQLRLEVKVDERELAQTNYVFLGAPFQVDGKPGDEAVTKRLLDTVAGLICLHTGQNFMRHCVFEGEIKAKDGTFSSPGESWKMPQPSEGPYLILRTRVTSLKYQHVLLVCVNPSRVGFGLLCNL